MTRKTRLRALIGLALAVGVLPVYGEGSREEAPGAGVPRQPGAPTDAGIGREVTDQLRWDNRVDADDVRVLVDDGVVTLSGAVPSYTARRAAELATWAIPGVRRVDNRLEIRPPAEIPPDPVIGANLQQLMGSIADLEAQPIEVEVEDGVVTLQGNVDALWKKRLAERLASNGYGVLGVISRITVVPTEKVEDEKIAEELVDALSRLESARSADITVLVRDGRVTLSGVVSTPEARRAAGEAADHTSGVTDVENELRVR